MNLKAKGARRERQTMKLLERAGYICTRNAASLGAYDVVAINAGGVLLVQVKSNGHYGKADYERLQDLPCPSCVSKAIWIWHDFNKHPVIKEVIPKENTL